MESDLRHAALCGALVGLRHDVGGAEIAVHLAVGDEVGVQSHAAADVEPRYEVVVGFGVVVELARHQQLDAHLLQPIVGHSLQQQVEPLVVAYEAEEQHIAPLGGQPYSLAGLLDGHRGAVVVVERMRAESARLTLLRVEEVGVGEHRAAHGHHAVDRAHEVVGEQAVARALLVRHQVVQYAHPAQPLALGHAVHGAQRRSHERQPELGDEQVGALLPYVTARSYPAERIDGVEHARNLQPLGSGLVAVLSLAGEEERRVLQREGDDLHLVSMRLVLTCYALVECCQAAAVGPSRAKNNHFHPDSRFSF